MPTQFMIRSSLTAVVVALVLYAMRIKTARARHSPRQPRWTRPPVWVETCSTRTADSRPLHYQQPSRTLALSWNRPEPPPKSWSSTMRRNLPKTNQRRGETASPKSAIMVSWFQPATSTKFSSRKLWSKRSPSLDPRWSVSGTAWARTQAERPRFSFESCSPIGPPLRTPRIA